MSADTLKRLETVFQTVFANKGIVLDMETSMNTIPEWDSFGQISLIIAVEEEFGRKFDFAQINRMNSVAVIMEILGNN